MDEKCIDKEGLIGIVKKFDRLLSERKQQEKKIALYAFGDTAMVLYGLKDKCNCLEFCVDSDDLPVLKEIQSMVEKEYGIIIEYYVDGFIPDTRIPRGFDRI